MGDRNTYQSWVRVIDGRSVKLDYRCERGPGPG